MNDAVIRTFDNVNMPVSIFTLTNKSYKNYQENG